MKATPTASIPPKASDRKIISLKISSDPMLSTVVMPENATARPAVATAREIDSRTSSPLAAISS